jgi:ribosome biogenesis GTPase
MAPPVAVGDWVVATADRVEAVLARWSSLERQGPDSGKAQVLATNVDLVLVTIPADRPNVGRVERELTLAWDSGARPVVVLTKTDLGDRRLADELASRLIGADIVATSTETGVGMDKLACLARGQTAVLLGPSGAGKSTLTNALLCERRQATAAVRAEDSRGRHTTSSRQLFALPGGGVIIDTPGLRSLGLMSAEGIGEVFPDVDEYASDCRFRDCEHRDEPGCAVTAAVAAGTLGAERLASYRKLAREAAAEQRRVDPLARREAQRLWKQRAKDARRQGKGR